MALPGFRNHPKFRRLVAALRMPEAHVLGHVEMMWEVCYESGNAVLGDSVDVELAAGWIGEPGALCSALAKCGGMTRSGLIEEVDEGVWQVHDLLDHAPEYVDSRRKRLEEKGKDKVCSHCGATFRTSDSKSRFCSDACRKADWRRRQKDADETKRDGTWQDRDGRGTDKDVSSDHYQPSPAQPSPGTTTKATSTNGTPDTPPASPPSASGAAAEVVGKPKKKKPRGKDFAIAALELSPGVEAAFNRVWARYPRQGWNFTTKRPAPRRINYAEAVKRFSEILQFCPVRTSEGDAITADDLADATLAWVNTRVKEARAENSEIPNVPCVANFFSSAEGSKHHWKEALLEFFQAIPEAACH